MLGMFVFNYSLDFEDQYIQKFPNAWIGFAIAYVYYLFPVASVLLLYRLFHPTSFPIQVWYSAFLLPLIPGADMVLRVSSTWFSHLSIIEARYWASCLSQLSMFPICFLALVMYRWQGAKDYAGLEIKPESVKLLFLLSLGMIPLILLASTFDDFLAQYPSYKFEAYSKQLPGTFLSQVLIYEFFYGLEFITVEWFFRGLMLAVFARYLGPAALWPMISLYALYHFGKPMGEAFSSIFGGFILGWISLHTRTIWLGVAVHLFVAWGMEAAAFWAEYR